MNSVVENDPEVAETATATASGNDGAAKSTRRRTTRGKDAPADQDPASVAAEQGEALAVTPGFGSEELPATSIHRDGEQAANEENLAPVGAGADANTNPAEIEMPEEQRLAVAAQKRRAEQLEIRRRQAVATVNRRAKARAARAEGEHALAKAYERVDGARLDRTVSFYTVPIVNVCKVDLQSAMQHTLFLTHMLPSMIGNESAKIFMDRTYAMIATFKTYAVARNTGLRMVWDAHMKEASGMSYRDSSKPTEQLIVPVTCPAVMDILDAVEALDNAARYARLLEVVCKMTSDEYSKEVMDIKKHVRRAFAAIAAQNTLAQRASGRANRDSRSGEYDDAPVAGDDQNSGGHERRRDATAAGESIAEATGATVGSAALVEA